MAGVKIKNLKKNFIINDNIFTALKDINLDIEDGSFVTIVGRSGSGKTTLLRLISGLENATSGEIKFSTDDTPKIGMVFQEPRLMPWLTVEKNMMFPLINVSKQKSLMLVSKYLRILKLEEFKDAYPSQISGGMAQRVALGRALSYEPDLILMDEPLSSLDTFTRTELRGEFVDLFSEQKKTIIYVTHDIEEAVYLGQKIIVIKEGRILNQYDVDMPYPRDISSKNFQNIKEKTLSLIMND